MSEITVHDIEDGERQIKHMKELIVKRQIAMRLYNNPDFKKLIVDEYFTNEAARLVQLSSDPAMPAAERADCLAMAQATGHLKRYLSATMQMGYVAERDLAENEASLEEMRLEFANQE